MKEWKRSFINEVIAAGDILKILSLKISKTWRRNCYCWEYAKSGIYTVRAGYEVVVQLRQNHVTRLISEPIITPLKKKVWNLKSSRKIKYFLLKALSGFVASASKLVEQHCRNDASCQRSGTTTKDINHILFECPPAL